MASEQVPAVAAEVVATPTTAPVQPGAAKAAKMAAINAGLAKLASEGAAVAADLPPVEEKPAEAEKPKADPKPEPAEEKPDEKTAKGLEAIERRDARARAELAAEKAAFKTERDLAIAEISRLRAEVTSIDDLKKLARSKPLDALKALGIESEDDLEVVARQTYAVSKSGKADPKNKAYADQTAKEREYASKLEAIEARQAELDEQFKVRDQKAQAEQFQTQWQDAAVKAIPADSLIGSLHAKNPGKARSTLLALGQQMEREAMEADGATKYDPSYTPAHADVIARYERDRRAELAELGIEVDAVIKKTAAAKPIPKTLDVSATGAATKPINGNPTREEKLRAITAGLKRLDSAAI